jgi:hypothetical protein
MSTNLIVRPAVTADAQAWLALWRGYCAALDGAVSEEVTAGVWHHSLGWHRSPARLSDDEQSRAPPGVRALAIPQWVAEIKSESAADFSSKSVADISWNARPRYWAPIRVAVF